MVDPKTVFSNKAEGYAKYRWDYAPQAVAAIFEIGRLTQQSAVADIAAGTGILTRHFAGRVRQIYAVEPNPEMRAVAARQLAAFPSISLVDGSAEATTLPAHSVDLISVAQALHWFEPQAALLEMGRILKRDGWLAVLRNNGTDNHRYDLLREILANVLGEGYAIYPASPREAINHYFTAGAYQRLTFDFQFRQSWPDFIGTLSSTSFMPDEADPNFEKIEYEVQKLFNRESHDGYLVVNGETELHIGRPASLPVL